ncbi:MAG: imidazoleglycerol-phosphate dehydratase HisB [Clostridia bacterium]|nr:imidazoleglycerol-phosphate dehydratase HisB [Clostridia bacterium]
MRTCEITRNTGETKIKVKLNLDGSGVRLINSGCGFLDHMLDLFARHGDFDLEVTCHGDSEVDFHHTTEDIGITLGQAFLKALGDKKGIYRYGDIILPMDETLILCAIDISGRGGAYIDLQLIAEKVGDFDTELCEEFMVAFAREAGLTLHLKQLEGVNSHHIIEGSFKALARVMKQAVAIDEKHANEIPSTKGVL